MCSKALFKDQQSFQNATQGSALRLDSAKWQGVRDSMGKCLGQWAPQVLWNFSPEQVQNLERLVKHLEELCCYPGDSRETKPTATCCGLALRLQRILSLDCLTRVYFKDSERSCWAFGRAALETAEIKQASTLPHLLEDASGAGERTTGVITTVHWQRYHTNQDTLTLSLS